MFDQRWRDERSFEPIHLPAVGRLNGLQQPHHAAHDLGTRMQIVDDVVADVMLTRTNRDAINSFFVWLPAPPPASPSLSSPQQLRRFHLKNHFNAAKNYSRYVGDEQADVDI
jgi:hypothetical protein